MLTHLGLAELTAKHFGAIDMEILVATFAVLAGFLVFWAVLCVMLKIMFKIADAVFKKS
jgi:hypothetical protein